MITALGKEISRERAYDLIIKNYIDDIVHAHNTDTLENILVDGLKGLIEWTDKDLETYVNEICVVNNPKLKI